MQIKGSKVHLETHEICLYLNSYVFSDYGANFFSFYFHYSHEKLAGVCHTDVTLLFPAPLQ